ncbi:MAG: GAF domain-containing protein [Anaerolineae bacterium]|nr:GAF domain-containing protein [Anaerolineae bacterium]
MEIQSIVEPVELVEIPEANSDAAVTHAELAALRAENARLKHEMAQVRAIARIAVEQPDTHTLAKLIAQQAADCMQTRQAWIGLVADDAVRVEAICDGNHVQPGDGLTILPGENGAGLVLLKRHTVICVDATRDPLITPEFRARFGCRSVLSVPMLDHQNEILGVIQWHDRADGAPFSEADTTTAEMIAMQAAVAFERSRIHTHLQHLKRAWVCRCRCRRMWVRARRSPSRPRSIASPKRR